MKQYDVIIIGSGPAGLGIAQSLEAAGVSYRILERENYWGGIPLTCGHRSFGINVYKYPMTAKAFIKKISKKVSASNIQTHTTALKVTPKGEVSVRTPEGLSTMNARKVVLATGCRESTRHGLLTSGLRPLEVMTTGALQRICNQNKTLPFGRTIIVGTEIVSFSALATLLGKGGKVVAMLEQEQEIATYRPLSLYTLARRIPVHCSTRITAIQGIDHVEGITVRQTTRHGEAKRFIPCDSVVFSGRFTAENTLVYASNLESFMQNNRLVVDQYGQSDLPAIMACGNVLHPGDPGDYSFVEGCRLGKKLAVELRTPVAASQLIPVICPKEFTSDVQCIRMPANASTIKADINLHAQNRLCGTISLAVNNKIVQEKKGSFLPRYRIAFKGVNLAPGKTDTCMEIFYAPRHVTTP